MLLIEGWEMDFSVYVTHREMMQMVPVTETQSDD